MNDVEINRTEKLCVRVLRQYIRQYNYIVRSLYVALVVLLHHVSIIPINILTLSVCSVCVQHHDPLPWFIYIPPTVSGVYKQHTNANVLIHHYV